jgi:hypothetical protein
VQLFWLVDVPGEGLRTIQTPLRAQSNLADQERHIAGQMRAFFAAHGVRRYAFAAQAWAAEADDDVKAHMIGGGSVGMHPKRREVIRFQAGDDLQTLIATREIIWLQGRKATLGKLQIKCPEGIAGRFVDLLPTPAASVHELFVDPTKYRARTLGYGTNEDGLPVLQIKLISVDGGPDLLWAIAPGDDVAFLAGVTLERASLRPIADSIILRAANIFGVRPTLEFRYALHKLIFDFGFVVLKNYDAPRAIAAIWDGIIADLPGAIEMAKTDTFQAREIRAAFELAEIDRNDIASVLGSKDALIKVVREARNSIRLKRGPTESTGLFWQEVARFARAHGCDLELPRQERGDIDTKPFLEFGLLMRDALVEFGRQLPGSDRDGDRFAHIAGLSREQVLRVLYEARRKISQ